MKKTEEKPTEVCLWDSANILRVVSASFVESYHL